MRSRNILLLYTDQQRWDTIAAAGNAAVSTPNLDRLAAQGVLFDNAFVNCPVCQPSRISMLTGRYPSALGITSNGVNVPEDWKCLQHHLRDVGYCTANFGKLHFLNHAETGRRHDLDHPDYGFDVLAISDEPGCYDDAYIQWVREVAPNQVDNCRVGVPPAWKTPVDFEAPRGRVTEPWVFRGPEKLTHTAYVGTKTVEFLQAHDGERPFFCISGFYQPHDPSNPPQRFVDLYRHADLPLPCAEDRAVFPEIDEEGWHRVVAHYYAMISHVDDQVGCILDTLEAEGLADTTTVIFTSDHGENLGDHGLIGKCQPYDSSTRVPLIVAGAGVHRSADVEAAIVEHVDIAPTVLELCGVTVPDDMQGRSLSSLLERGGKGRTDAFVEMRYPNDPGGFRAIRDDAFLYVWRMDGQEELYNLNVDPGQTLNLASNQAYAGVLADYRLRLLQRTGEALPHRQRTAEY